MLKDVRVKQIYICLIFCHSDDMHDAFLYIMNFHPHFYYVFRFNRLMILIIWMMMTLKSVSKLSKWIRRIYFMERSFHDRDRHEIIDRRLNYSHDRSIMPPKEPYINALLGILFAQFGHAVHYRSEAGN